MSERNKRKYTQDVVVSDKMDKTISFGRTYKSTLLRQKSQEV